jgi:uncharacterized repeat protein (TIGR02543 family)
MKNFTPPGRVVAFPGTFRVFSFLIVAALLLSLAGCPSPSSSDPGETGSFTVTFNLNGGTLNYSTNSQVRTLTYPNTELGTDNFPGNPSWNGSGSYTFAGWNTSSSGTGKFLTASTTVLGEYASATSLTVYAQWVSTTQPSGSYIVTFRMDNDTTSAPWAVKVTTGTPATIGSSNFPADPTKKNSSFNGWYTSTGTYFTASSTVTANTPVFAQWTGTSNNNPSLSAPTGLSASVSGSSINLSWSSVSNAAYYKVYRSSSSSGPYSERNTTTYTTYTDSSLSAGTYYYKVSAVSSSGTESTQSSYSYATVMGGGGFPPSSPTPLTFGNSTSGTLTAGGERWYSFTASSSNSYSVYWYDTNGGGSYTADIKVSAYTSNQTAIFTAIDRGYSTPQIISSRSGTIYLKVEGNNANSSGTYAIRVNNQ